MQMLGYIQGTVVSIRQWGGCVEVTVNGEAPGSFSIDNCLYRMIVANHGENLIGQLVRYQDAYMRFLDSPGDEEEFTDRRVLADRSQS